MDLFISYASADDAEYGGLKWVTEFQRALKIRLRMRRGQEPDIWWDQQDLRGSQYLEDEITERLAEVGLFVAVMSPSFLTSEWCVPKELQGFCAAAEQNLGVRIGNKSRLFNVVKTNVSKELPPELQPLRRFEFFERDIQERLREFQPIREDFKFWNTLDDLVTELAELLDELATMQQPQVRSECQPTSPASPASPASPTAKKTVYLAEVGVDLRDVRDDLRRSLKQQGYEVLPVESLAQTPKNNYRQWVQDQIVHCEASVHLLSAVASVSDNLMLAAQQQLEQAQMQVQVEIAGEQTNRFVRMLCVPQIGSTRAESTDGLIQWLEGDPDFRVDTVENLKSEILWRLRSPDPPIQVLAAVNGRSMLYLDCDLRDLDTNAFDPLYEFLENWVQVVLPPEPDPSVNVIELSEQLMRQCDGILIYHGCANERWFRRRLRALQKSIYPRHTPLRAKGVYLAAPVTPNKQIFTHSELHVVQGFQQFEPLVLDPFLTQLNAGGREA